MSNSENRLDTEIDYLLKNATVEQLENELVKRGYIRVFWSEMDIRYRAREKKITLTEEQIKKVAENMARFHDANYGINWDYMDDHIRDEVK